MSLLAFLYLIKKALAPMEQLDLFADVLDDQEFTARFSQSKNKELGRIGLLFNRMLDQLYEERLRLGDRKGMLQQLLDEIPVSIIVFDYDGAISQLNPAARKLLQIKAEDSNPPSFGRVSHPIVKHLSSLSANKPRLISDTTGKRYRCQRNQFKDRGFERDFILIQELSSELSSSEKNTYEKLIRLMSHEVNNTMAATSSLLKTYLHDSDDRTNNEERDYQKALEMAIKRIDHLNGFMQGYASMVRLPEPSLEQCNLHHLLLSNQSLFCQQLQDRNIQLHYKHKLSDEGILAAVVNADRSQLEQVLINIIKNAMEAIGNDGYIEVNLKQENDRLKLSIVDSGCGISEQAQQALFTPFFTTKDEGQGLGLMLCREILNAHHFQFSLYNMADRGACFEIIMPVGD